MKHKILILGLLLVISGCRQVSDFIKKLEHPQHDSYLSECNFQEDIKIIKKENSDEILSNAELGLAYYFSNNNLESNRYFTKAINAYEAKEKTFNLYQYYIRNKYQGEDYDKVLLRTYKALNHLMQGNTDRALVSLHRAREVQTRTERQLKDFQRSNLSSLKNFSFLSRYELLFQSVNPTHTPNRNPFSYYITALAEAEDGEYSSAISNIKLAKQLIPNLDILNKKIQQYQLGKPIKTVELFFDVGKSPTKKQEKVKMNLNNGVERSRYLPYYKLFSSKVEEIIISDSKGRTVAKSSLMADIKSIKINEFKEKLPSMISILSGEVADASIPHLLENVNPSLRILYNIGSAFSKPRKLSTWTLLPEKILVISFIPKQREKYTIKVILKDKKPLIKTLDLSKQRNTKNIYRHFTIKKGKICQ